MTAAHKAPGLPRLTSYPDDFTPAHCAGTSCFHTHTGDQPLPMFADLTVVDHRCGRAHIHGAHDTDQGRCPGVRDANALPKPVIAQRVARVRAAIGGPR